jgi:hypothetical protein
VSVLTGIGGEIEGIFGHSESDCPRESGAEKSEELIVLEGPPARLEERRDGEDWVNALILRSRS